MGLNSNVLQYKRKTLFYVLNVNIDTEEVHTHVDKTDSNHDKSEVKVVFIRNGFHTALKHNQSVHLELYFQKIDHVETEILKSKIINTFFQHAQ